MDIKAALSSCKLHSSFPSRIDTIDGTAEAGSDFKPMHDVLEFLPREREKSITVEIVDDNEWEPDEVFFVKLTLDPSEIEKKVAKLGKKSITEVTIVNDDGKKALESNTFISPLRPSCSVSSAWYQLYLSKLVTFTEKRSREKKTHRLSPPV